MGTHIWVVIYGWSYMGDHIWVVIHEWSYMGGHIWVVIYGWSHMIIPYMSPLGVSYMVNHIRDESYTDVHI